MSNFGQIATAAVGLAVGTFVGNPLLGLQIGMVAGGFLFPEDLPGAQGPRITDASVTTSTIGSAIAIVRGRTVVTGNIIWTAPLVENATTEDVSAKGGPKQEVTTYSYTRSYAVGLCEGEMAGIIRVWRNEKLVYDVRGQQDGEDDNAYIERVAASQAYAEKFVFYPGDEDQLPDPTIEADQGVGNVPAFRGLCYIVFEDEDVTDTNGRPPNLRIEVSESVDDISSTITDRQPQYLAPWSGITIDPRACENDHEYYYKPVYGGSDIGWTTLSAALASAEEDFERTLETDILGWDIDPWGNQDLTVFPFDTVDIGEWAEPMIHFNIEEYADANISLGALPSADEGELSTAFYDAGIRIGTLFYWTGNWEPGGHTYSGIFQILADGDTPTILPDIADIYFITLEGPFADCTLWFWPDARIFVRRVVRVPDNPCSPRCENEYPALPENGDYCVIDGSIERDLAYSVASGTFKALANYTVFSGEVTRYPLGPVIISGSSDDNQTFWEAAYNQALADGKVIPSGLVYGVGYPVTPTAVYVREYQRPALDPVPPTIGSVVEGICLRTGMPQDRIDVSELTTTIQGYRLATVMTARQAIDPLRSYKFFDAVESDGLLKFRVRGGAVVATLGTDDLAAHMAGEQTPPLVSMDRAQSVDLAQILRLRYEISSKDYQAGMQQAQRQITGAVNKVDVELAIPMEDDKAAEIANVLLQDMWTARETYKSPVSPQWLQLECSDPVELPISGEDQRARISRITLTPPFGVIQMEFVRDEVDAYESSATGASPVPSDDTLGLAGPTALIVIDGPALNAASDDAGVFVAVRPVLNNSQNWIGATLYTSSDSGTTYQQRINVPTEATTGTASLLADGHTTVWDYENEIIVTMVSGSPLQSRTEEAVLGGANAAFIGAAGRWELIQFQYATLNMDGTYTLSKLLRGRRGTEHATSSHEEGDDFVVIDSSLKRLVLDVAAIGREMLIKPVTVGTNVAATSAVSITPEGIALKPYSVANPSVEYGDTYVRSGLTFNAAPDVIFVQGARGNRWFAYITESGNPYNDFYDSDDGKLWRFRNRLTSSYPPQTSFENWTYNDGLHVFIEKSSSNSEDDAPSGASPDPWDVTFYSEGFASSFGYSDDIDARPVGVYTLDDTIHLLDADGNFYTTTDGTSWTQIPYGSGLTGLSGRGYVIDPQSRVHVRKFGTYYYMMVGVQRAGDGEATGTNKLLRSTDLQAWSELTIPVSGTLKLYGLWATDDAVYLNGTNNSVFFTVRSANGTTFSLVDSGVGNEQALSNGDIVGAGNLIYAVFDLNGAQITRVSTDAGVSWNTIGPDVIVHSDGAVILTDGSEWTSESETRATAFLTGGDSDGSIEISWQRRSRYFQELPSGTDVPVNEESERYEIVIGDESFFSTSPSYALTAQEQADSGVNRTALTEPQTEVVIYQLSARVGRGYSSEIII